MAYTPINKSSLNFKATSYLGSASAVTVSGLEFQPDLVWVKDRDNGNNHCLVDAVRGVGKYIESNNTNAQVDNATNSISAFTSDGFTTGTANPANESASTTKGFAAFNWKANGAGSLNEVGSIDSTVSANTTAGFSIVKFTGTGANATVGHGLGAVPKMMIFKNLDEGAEGWMVYHVGIGNTKKLGFDSTTTPSTSSTFWQDTTPTSTVFSVGSNHGMNGPDNMVAYCFADVTGFSKFGTYTGNGNDDGPFIYTGFKPAFIIMKNTQQNGDDWILHNNKFPGYNVNNQYLYSNTSNAQIDATTLQLDMYSNGFKIRKSTGAFNNSGELMVYMAFGQALVGTNDIPATAK